MGSQDRELTIWAERARLGDRLVRGVRLHVNHVGRITGITPQTEPALGDELRLGLVVPGFGNGHSHAFHRRLRGRTHNHGGDFWRWRDEMYKVAISLDPDLYRELATHAFTEMVVSGYTAVGEFHYAHHQPDGSPYRPPHAMELALADAAEAAGIRLTLLDSCYLSGGIRRKLAPEQLRFSDGNAEAWLERWHSLRDALHDRPGVTLGAAIHSVRAVPRGDLTLIARELPSEALLHVHLSEQPRENEDCLEAYGITPTGLLDACGLLTPRLQAVHATHLTDDDIRLLGSAGVGIVMCPTTEADLGDGIGQARTLLEAGAAICIGSDQNAIIDPLLELRGLEYGERLAARARGRFSPDQLWTAGTVAGYRALGLDDGGLVVGGLCDLVELDSKSVRTSGAEPEQLPLVATASDVLTVIIGGKVAARNGESWQHT